ncbi:TPA: hypothetical protein QCY18_003615 [Bacillus cereus]|uniref:hypothetical protein n=1 Tax=Bacillus cereus group TaxID=86661 RepID=UPI0008461B31|nr:MULTISPECIES: hypothetical protein [Bacillus cereus group]MED2680493.1 hypothetical protein [Bacillus thuringiensis]ASI79568.1 hypothetical protein BA202_20735 [Bacillus cereus]MCC2484881.1 hypothetical protein [Bacillus pacificus]MDA1605205.1 hypothetical protein [Bacillus cereus group sp. TH208-1LC]MEB9078808.1 hypothetical protein [Bacillus cereus]
MELTKEGKELFRRRVEKVVTSEMYRQNFFYLLKEIDKRDVYIEELEERCKVLEQICTKYKFELEHK